VNIKNKTIIIYECPTISDYIFINRYIKKNISVYIIEPFGAYHHKKRIRFYPPHLSSYIEKLVQERKISILKADEINAKEIYQMSADKAVEVIEPGFKEYRKEYEELFKYVSRTLKSSIAEDIFKKDLCNRLAEFYSVNILLHRIEKLFSPGLIRVYPDTNVRSYLYLKTLLSGCNQDFFEHPDIQFPKWTYVTSFYENLKEYIIAIASLSAQTLASGLFGSFQSFQKKNKKIYSYGMTIISPLRQLANNQRGPDFIIDNNKIRSEEVVYFPLINLTGKQKKQLKSLSGSVYYPPKIGRCFSNFTEWKRLLRFALRKNFFLKSEEINTACNAFFNYFRWLHVLKDIKLRHFITHCDFGISYIGRNIALSQAGVQTWYFTDSMNHGCHWKTEDNKNGMRHPFWTYLNYDHFVTWDEFLARYFKEHPGRLKNTHIAGCFWSGHIKERRGVEKKKTGSGRDAHAGFLLAVFDSTYSRNGMTSYAEGVAFAKHILRLADDYPDVHIFLKEKKQRGVHKTLDPVLGPRLLDIYRRMDSHPSITICSDREDASELIAISDMIISFPFTSTTFEALSINKAAIWHDPMGYYRNTPYAEVGGITTHSYEELKLKVLEIRRMGTETYKNPVQTGSPLMDPFRDGKAIDRFRELLVSS